MKSLIAGVVWSELTILTDDRGWLCELFRSDEIPMNVLPAMAYASMTAPGIERGPHEHRDQTDYFCFLGPSDFRLTLHDLREQSPTFGQRQTEVVGSSRPMAVIVPPGVVHGYRNVGDVPGLVFNAPNRLYAGRHRAFPVDEIRHENANRERVNP